MKLKFFQTTFSFSYNSAWKMHLMQKFPKICRVRRTSFPCPSPHLSRHQCQIRVKLYWRSVKEISVVELLLDDLYELWVPTFTNTCTPVLIVIRDAFLEWICYVLAHIWVHYRLTLLYMWVKSSINMLFFKFIFLNQKQIKKKFQVTLVASHTKKKSLFLCSSVFPEHTKVFSTIFSCPTWTQFSALFTRKKRAFFLNVQTKIWSFKTSLWYINHSYF